jgi:mannose-1-phosphate guanylyltransferase
MAGGAGTRLWPLSREKRPKPVLRLVEKDRSMFQIAVERLQPLFPPERILVVASADLTPLLKEHAPQLPDENYIVEPVGRDTAPAVGLGAIHIRRRDPEAIMAVLTADHYIADVEKFRNVLNVACRVAARGMIVTLGIKPTFASTGFGYIERGPLDQVVEGVEVYVLQRFREKPDQATADSFIADGRYSWNSGMFIWPVQRVMAEFERHAPALYAELERLADAMGTAGYESLLSEIWPQIKRISVDYALMEHIQQGVRVIPVEMGWTDIGNFETLYDILSLQSGGNVIHSKEPLVIDTTRTLVFSDRLVATLGVEDLVIIDTDDVLLICHRDRSQDVKQLVEHLKKNQRNEYL